MLIETVASSLSNSKANCTNHAAYHKVYPLCMMTRIAYCAYAWMVTLLPGKIETFSA